MTVLEEPLITDVTDGVESEVTLAEYLSFWGDGGDNALFYNYASCGDDPAYLEELEGALDRLLADVVNAHPESTVVAEKNNLTICRDFVKAKRAALNAGEAAPAIVNESEQFTNLEGDTFTYGAIREAMRKRGSDPFPMKLVSDDHRVFAAAVNQGIDSRLQACFVPSRGDTVDQRGYIQISAESMPVLLRRLFEMGNEHADNLAQSIIDILFEDEEEA